MMPVKRLEIIIGAQDVDRVVKVLRTFEITGYAVVREVDGQGNRRTDSVDPLTGEAGSRMILTTCSPEQIDDVVESLRPLLSLYGGTCVVFDAQCVIHCRVPASV